MKLVAKVRLLPTPEQAILLKQTLETANRACNFISERAWESRMFNQFPLQKIVYYDTRSKFDLVSQLVIRAISKVADAYKIDRKSKRVFRKHGAINYDERILNYRMTSSSVSIWCMGGRQKIPFVAGEHQLELLKRQQGQSSLALINGKFYLFAVCDIEEPTPDDVKEFLGVDTGIVNIASDSDGNVYSGKTVSAVRHRNQKLRSKLQKKGTHQAKRLLKKLSGRESRFSKHTNHVISKRIVATAKDTGRGIALEDLSGIADRVTVRKSQRATLHSWAFYDLRFKIEYKARRAGVPVEVVDPRNTSRTCSECNHVDKKNRKTQSSFKCVSCGHSGPADTIAAVNISRRAASNPAIHPAPTD